MSSDSLIDVGGARGSVLRLHGRWPAILGVAACGVLGVALSAWPHVAWWGRLGIPVWLAEYDDLCAYLAPASQAYFNHPARLTEAVRVEGGSSPYPWLQMVPGILVARAAGLGPLGI